MATGKTANIKSLLSGECLPALAKGSVYFSLADVRAWLRGQRVVCPPPLLRGYLSGFMRAGVIHNAGRGWYSRLAQPFVLDPKPVASLADGLGKAFPLVAFSCWSTEQIKGAMHHLLSRFVTVVNVEADAMESVWEHLRDAAWDAWLNPRGAQVARFAVRERTVVVRRESSKSPSREHLAPIEKLLVELYFEARDLDLMSLADFHAMLANLAGSRRIQIATLMSYAVERKLPLGQLFGEDNQLTPPFSKRRN